MENLNTTKQCNHDNVRPSSKFISNVSNDIRDALDQHRDMVHQDLYGLSTFKRQSIRCFYTEAAVRRCFSK